MKSGGVVSNITGYIGSNRGSTGEVTVTGAGSEWWNSGLFIGGDYLEAGGAGTLNVTDSGLVIALGTINLDGGILNSMILDLTAGTFNMLDGIL